MVGIAIAVPMFATGHATAQASHPSGSPNASCYPNNEFVAEAGAFANAASGGQGTGDGEVSLPDSTSNPTTHVSWNVHMSVTGNSGNPGDASPGSISGGLRMVIDLPTGTVIFTSTCIAEAQNEGKPTDETGVTAAMEGEFEGNVTGFPGTKGSTHAVGSISLNKSTTPGVIFYTLGIELGSTCHEEANNELNASSTDTGGHGSFADPGTTGYRVGLPPSGGDPYCTPTGWLDPQAQAGG